ncbi:hypothetical protein GCM10027060_19520 [Nesterenkonia halophila]
MQAVPDLPPAALLVEGRRLAVTRAWPAADGARLAVELDDGGARRAGFLGADGLELLPPGRDPKLAALARPADLGEVVSHRPGRRAVVRLDDRFVKVVRRGRAAGILRGIERAAAFDGPFRTPAVLDHDASTVTFAALPGIGLHDPTPFSPRRWRRAWETVCSAWITASSAPADPAAPVHDAAAEAAVLTGWVDRVACWIADVERTRAAAELLAGRLRRLPDRPLAPAHRDLHDKQLLVAVADGERDEDDGDEGEDGGPAPGLLDADTACLADPALDLGNLRAHATLRRRQGIWAPAQSRTVAATVTDAAARRGVPEEALATYELAALLRLGCVYAVRPRHTEVAAALRAAVSGSVDSSVDSVLLDGVRRE